jgi:hypothetical protein
MSRTLIICECCEEEWPEDFFCKICSNNGELIERRVPDPQWSYSIEDDESILVEEYVTYITCLNCCMGHSPAPARRKEGE